MLEDGGILKWFLGVAVFAPMAALGLRQHRLEQDLRKDYVRRDEHVALREDVTYIRERVDELHDKMGAHD